MEVPEKEASGFVPGFAIWFTEAKKFYFKLPLKKKN